MCSQDSSVEKKYINEFQILEESYTSEEESDYEERSVNFANIRRSKSLLNKSSKGPGKSTTIVKKKSDGALGRTRGFSLEDKMKAWHRSSVVYQKSERAAKLCTEMVEDDTLKQLSQTIRIAGSIAVTGADINEELRRQELVSRKADNDISFAEYGTDQLKGVRTSFIDFDMLDGQNGLCSLSRSYSSSTSPMFESSPKCTKQLQIKSSMKELHAALDLITVQQMDAPWSMDAQAP